MKHRFHVLGLPHTQINTEYLTCAYTQKIRNFVNMMCSLGHEVHVYGGEHSAVSPLAHKHVVVTDEEQLEWFGPNDQNGLFGNITWDPSDIWWQTINNRTSEIIRDIGGSTNFLCLIAGWAQKPVSDLFPEMITNEWGVGYEGIFSNFCCYESYAWKHFLYGKYGYDGRWYDTVIPNSFDVDDFPLVEEKEDYLLFIGRLVSRKGPHVAAELAKRAGMKLKIAGPGATEVSPGKIVCPELTIEGDHVEYIGPVGLKERGELMSKAAVVLTPTLYVEPFGGVACEAMMCGTPVVSSDWGAFTETVEPGITGYRFHTVGGGAEAIKKAMELDPLHIRLRAHQRFATYNVRHQYEDWYDRLAGLRGEGWYA